MTIISRKCSRRSVLEHSKRSRTTTIRIQQVGLGESFVIFHLPCNAFFLVFLSLSWKNVIGWMLNMAICFVCLVKLFVHGDPIVHELTMDEFHLLKKKADQLMNEVGDESGTQRDCSVVRRNFTSSKWSFGLESTERSRPVLPSVLRKTLRLHRWYSHLLPLLSDLAKYSPVAQCDLRRTLVNLLVWMDKIDRYTELQSRVELLSGTIMEDRVPLFGSFNQSDEFPPIDH